MKWYWVVLIIVVLIIIGWLIFKPKPTEQKVVIDTKTACGDMQLAPPPAGKRWSCVDGNWVLVDINGVPEQKIFYIIDGGRRSYRYHNH